MNSRFSRLAACAAAVTLLSTALVFVIYADESKKGDSARATSPVPLPRAPLLKEDSRLIDVEGLVLDMKDDLKKGKVHRAVFQPKDGLGYFILLENELLEKTLALTSHGERPVKVRGTITTFKKQNYLLLDWAAVKRK